MTDGRVDAPSQGGSQGAAEASQMLGAGMRARAQRPLRPRVLSAWGGAVRGAGSPAARSLRARSGQGALEERAAAVVTKAAGISSWLGPSAVLRGALPLGLADPPLPLPQSGARSSPPAPHSALRSPGPQHPLWVLLPPWGSASSSASGPWQLGFSR